MYNERHIDIHSFAPLSNSKKLEFLVMLSSLAPSAHNTQPWQYLLSDKSIMVQPNLERKLPYSDRENRQLFLSLGAAIENLVLASAGYGLKFQTNFDFNSGAFQINYENLEIGTINTNLLKAIISRQTNRLPFEKRIIDSDVLKQLTDEAESGVEIRFISDEATKSALRKVVEESVRAAFQDNQFTSELSNWIKPSNKKYQLGMPGYTIGVPVLFSYLLPFLIKHFDLRNMQAKMHNDWLLNAPTYGIITSDGDDIEAWQKSGMSFEKMALHAEQLGLKIGIIGAPIETGDHYIGLQKAIQTNHRPQMFFRIGYGRRMPHNSPRLSLNKILQK